MSVLPAVLLSGPPASGKTNLSHLVARHLHAAVIDQDVATGPLVRVVQQLAGVDDLDDERLAGLTREPRYRVVLDLAVDNLASGMPVVLVAPFTAERTDPTAWAAAHGRLVAAGGSTAAGLAAPRAHRSAAAAARARRHPGRGQARR